MNKRINKFYIAIHENEVVYGSTNLKDFISKTSGIVGDMKSLSYYRKVFLSKKSYKHIDGLGKVFYFHMIRNK